jgi:hypothetical protein
MPIAVVFFFRTSIHKCITQNPMQAGKSRLSAVSLFESGGVVIFFVPEAARDLSREESNSRSLRP